MVDKLTHLKQLEAESIHIIREVAAEFGAQLGQWGSWLACDTGAPLIQADRGDAIAGKPAPTVFNAVL